MDLREWQTGIVGALSAVVAALFTRLRYKRAASAETLLEAQDSVAAQHVKGVFERLRDAEAESIAHQKLYLLELRRADQATAALEYYQREVKSNKDDIARLNEQVNKLTAIVIRLLPYAHAAAVDTREISADLRSSGFGELHTALSTPPRKAP